MTNPWCRDPRTEAERYDPVLNFFEHPTVLEQTRTEETTKIFDQTRTNLKIWRSVEPYFYTSCSTSVNLNENGRVSGPNIIDGVASGLCGLGQARKNKSVPDSLTRSRETTKIVRKRHWALFFEFIWYPFEHVNIFICARFSTRACSCLCCYWIQRSFWFLFGPRCRMVVKVAVGLSPWNCFICRCRWWFWMNFAPQTSHLYFRSWPWAWTERNNHAESASRTHLDQFILDGLKIALWKASSIPMMSNYLNWNTS